MNLPATTGFRNIYSTHAGLTSEVRLSLYKDAINVFSDHPLLGSGPDTFQDVSRKYSSLNTTDYKAKYAHNEYLQHLSDTGLAGFLALLILISYFSVSTIKAYRKSTGEWYRVIGIGALFGCLSFMIHSLFDFNFRIPSNLMLFTVIFSTGYCAINTRGEINDTKFDLKIRKIDLRDRWGLSYLVALLLLMIALSIFAIRDHLASYYRSNIDKDSGNAGALVKKALELNPVDPVNHFEMGLYLRSRGEVESSIVHFKRALSLNVTDPYLSYEIFRSYRSLSMLREAAFYLYRTIESDPMNGQWYKIAGDFYLESDNLAKAAANYKKAMKLEMRYAKGIFGRFLDISRDVLIARSMIPEDAPHLVFVLARELVERDMFMQAQSLIMKAPRLAPVNEKDFIILIDDLIKKSQYRVARNILEGQGKLENYKLKTAMGVVFCNTGDLKEGVELLKEAFEQNTLDTSSLDHLYNILISRDKDLLFRMLERLAVKYRNKGHIHYLLSKYYDREGEWYLALNEAKVSVSMDIYNYNYRLNLGKLYSKKKLYIDAIDEFQKIIKLSPGFIWVRKYIADEYEKLGNMEEAERWRN